jgi:hypothetical protein
MSRPIPGNPSNEAEEQRVACQERERLQRDLDVARQNYFESTSNKLSRLSGSRVELRRRDESAQSRVQDAERAFETHILNCEGCKATKR